MKTPAAMTDQELKAAMDHTTESINRAAVRDYEAHGPYHESPGTRVLVKRWQALDAEWQRRKEA